MKLIFTQPVKIFIILGLNVVFTLVPAQNHMNPVQNLISYFCDQFNITFVS